MCHMSLVTCHVWGVTCHVSHVTGHMSPVTFPLSPTATATDPPLANSPTMQSRLVHQDRTQKRKKSPLGPPSGIKLLCCFNYCDFSECLIMKVYSSKTQLI